MNALTHEQSFPSTSDLPSLEVQEAVVTLDLPLKPWQRLAASMFATGTPIHSIAVHVTQPVTTVSDFITSRRGQIIISDVLSENKARLDDLLEAAAVDSLLTLIKIRDTSPLDNARISACKELLAKTLPAVKAREQKRSESSAHGNDPEEEIKRLREKVTQI